MPHGQDVERKNDPASSSTYECLQCGTIVESETHPGACECGGEFHNRAKSLE
ncbi:rubrerythrin-like domain-containing protein [Halorhabdus sp. CBA1104]|uniref:rubrerythrin-like domain-containing protein n=1 Tax=Halorhabdus sp. CBA1104 TaxID=1380432 RepID=UPI0012B2CCE8|nr:rubrerythrin-like domain-containing protein [Halorhabdus sp. CBA1104]QGN07059.1 rubrerythrin-like domain-containing protein [Halorhabdus sp. CBA1104]